MAYLAALTLAEGRRAGFVTVAGIAMGLLLVSLLAAFGVATFVSKSTALYAALKWAGVFYMLWLAYDIWRAKDQAEADFAAESPMTTYVARGFLTNVLNPKAAVFFIAVLPQFIDPQHDSLRRTLRLSVAYAIVATFVHARNRASRDLCPALFPERCTHERSETCIGPRPRRRRLLAPLVGGRKRPCIGGSPKTARLSHAR